MGLPSSGNLSIKGAAGSGRSIDTEMSAVSSGSLSTLSSNSIEHTGGTAPPGGSADTNTAPYGMREFYGYSHVVPDIWEIGDSSVQTNYSQISSNGDAVYTMDIEAGTGGNEFSYIGNTLRMRIDNTSTSSSFGIWILNTEPGNTSNWKYNVAGQNSTFSGGNIGHLMWVSVWSSSTSLADACPDSFNVNWSTSTTQDKSTPGNEYDHEELNSGTHMTSCNHDSSNHGAYYFSDNVDSSYNNTLNQPWWSGKRFKDTAIAYDEGGFSNAYSYSTITFNVTFKKAGYTDTSTPTWKWQQKASAVVAW